MQNLIRTYGKMDEDQQVTVLLPLNLNGTTGGDLSSSWKDDFIDTTHDSLIDKSSGNDQRDHHEAENNLIQRDFEFVKKHAGDADPEVILSLLSSHSSNPNRLELVMCDLLNIPNAAELIKEFRSGFLRVGDKRSFDDSNQELEDTKKAKTKDTESYLQQMRDMFPDADGLFLISECQQLESWEDFSRFVNTVMLSGVYPKKGAVEYSPRAESVGVVGVFNAGDYRTVENLSSDEEISSSGLTGTPRKRRRRRLNRNSDSTNSSPHEKVNDKLLSPPVVDVIDIASDTTEPYEIPDQDTLRQIFTARYPANDGIMEVEEILPVDSPEVWKTSISDDIDKILKNEAQGLGPDLPGTSTPGPSGFGTRPHSRMSLHGKSSFSFDDAFEEKSLAEIIESKRTPRRSFLAGDSIRKTDLKELQSLLNNSVIQNGSEVSSPEVSTTYRPEEIGLRRQESETDGGYEEGDDAPTVSEEWLAEQTANLIRIFPNTDPSYLREEVVKMSGSSNAVNEFVIAKLERNDMPSRAEYEKKLEMEELQSRYTKNFSIEDFLKAVPDPWAYFTQGNRNCAKYKTHSLCYLKTNFRDCYMRDIIDAFKRNNYNLYFSCQELKNVKKKRRVSRRSEFECNQNRPTTIDIQFLQEVAFIENENKIRDYIEGEKIARQIKFDEAKRTGSLLECQCCFDSEVMVEDISYCPKDHAFCKICIVRSVEMEMAYGRFSFGCLANCQEKFTLACLQNVLKPELFSKVIQAIQLEEIRAAEIEDLVQCPFCNYATIMPPEEKVMTCLNPECLKESCRLCKELNHVPLRCDEVEKSEEVKMRTYIENKMTEALVRTCYKCGKKFVKEDGCNKMTCTCGAKMCYVCRKPVSDYSHFNGQGGTEYHKCPLYSTNDELHVELVKRVGEEAKAVIMQANPNTKLLHDPTALTPQRTHQTPMPGVNNGAALDVAMRAIMGTLDQEDGEGVGERQNRDRREIRRETNPYYNRYHRHRHRALIESESEEDEEYRNPRRPQHNHHNHHLRHHPQVHNNRNFRYHHRHHQHHHHHCHQELNQ